MDVIYSKMLDIEQLELGGFCLIYTFQVLPIYSLLHWLVEGSK